VPNIEVAQFVAKSGLDLIKTQAGEVLKEVPAFSEATEYAEALEAGHDTVKLFQQDAPVIGEAVIQALHPLPAPPPPPPTPPPPSSFSDKVAGFIATTYIDLLHHSPDAQSAASWETQLNSGLSRTKMVEALTSSGEHRRIIVDALYSLFLGRSPDAAAEGNWLQYLANGGTIQQIEPALAGSQEFFQVEGGGTEAGFLRALYHITLGRDLDANAEAALENAMDNGLGALTVATVVATSPEALQDQVQAIYTQLLHRAADPAGLSYFVQQLEHGAGIDVVFTSLMSTPEFFPLPPAPPPPPPTSNPFAGSYTGSYSGSGTAFGFSAPVSGAVAFTVSASGVITVSVPGAGTGTLSRTGSASFAAGGGSGVIQGALVTFSGSFVITGGVATATGSWTATFSGGSGSGSWTAVRG
jgi:hypothetical protein